MLAVRGVHIWGIITESLGMTLYREEPIVPIFLENTGIIQLISTNISCKKNKLVHMLNWSWGNWVCTVDSAGVVVTAQTRSPQQYRK